MKTFTETQKFNQMWVWLVLIAATLIPLITLGAGVYQQLIKGISFGDKPMSDNGLIFAFLSVLIFTGGIIVFMARVKLTTVINKNGISIAFFPLLLKEKTIKWTDIESFQVMKYKPIVDYGGWGYRLGKGGKAYNVAGNMGLKLKFKSGKHLLIGTQESAKMQQFLDKLDPLTPNSNLD
jgi:hypothetical protein